MINPEELHELTGQRERLQKVKKIYTHDRCPDGYASAMILANALPDAEVHFHLPGTSAHARIPAEEGILFCDLSPPEARVEEFLAAKAIVLDHHETAADITTRFAEKDLGTYSLCYSGAVLAARVWDVLTADRPNREQRAWIIRNFASLISTRDTWSKTSPNWDKACEVSAFVRFMGEELLDRAREDTNGLVFTDFKTFDGGEIGRMLHQRTMDKLDRVASEACTFMCNSGLQVAVITDGRSISDVSDVCDVDLVVAFHYYTESNQPFLKFSLRSRPRNGRWFHCGNFSHRHGGGGHHGAAGYRSSSLLNPYETLKTALNLIGTECWVTHNY